MTGELVKAEGAGNDFLLGTGAWALRLADEPDLVRRLCHRRHGIGADGTLALEVAGADAVRLIHRNADGSTSAFCANGTRCAALAGVELLGLDRRLRVITGWAEIPAVVAGNEVALELPPPTSPSEVVLETGGRRWRGRLLTLGVPHLVIPVADLDAAGLEEAAPGLRRDPALGPEGANVHLVADAPDGLRIRSFERGVEAETLCCGSGAVAAALLELGRRDARVLVVEARSGARLVVEVLDAPPVAASRLTGPARLVARLSPIGPW